jgi:acyl-coenzyme A thioesterase PaaI-like protein
VPTDLEAPGARLLRLWRRLASLSAGRLLFSLVLGRMVPYSGRLRARIRELEPGHVRLTLADRRGLRNHLGSLHAVALTNLGELATGLAVLTALPPGVRGIVIRLETTYRRKARGHLTATATWHPPSPLVLPSDVTARAELVDDDGHLVADVRATWRLGATP